MCVCVCGSRGMGMMGLSVRVFIEVLDPGGKANPQHH